jgi:hypothetical protein
MKEKVINWLIKTTKADTNKISDGYHTFEELYEHRITLFAKISNIWRFNEFGVRSWKSVEHSDGSVWEGWFIAGIGRKKRKQITYHIPMKNWDDFRCEVIEKAPKYDGHTPKDVIERLKKL